MDKTIHLLKSIVAGLFLFPVLTLIGWGLGHFGSFFDNPVRFIFVIMMAILTTLVAIFVPNSGQSSEDGDKQKKMQKHKKISLLVLQFVPTLIIIFAPFFDRRDIGNFNDNDMLRYIGLILAFFGFIFMNWAIKVLDKQFSVEVTVQENRKLITTGPYKYIRHPRYLGIIIFFTGVSLVFLSWICLIAVLCMLQVLIWKIKDEENLMYQEFNQEWPAYRDRTFAIIPYIW